MNQSLEARKPIKLRVMLEKAEKYEHADISKLSDDVREQIMELLRVTDTIRKDGARVDNGNFDKYLKRAHEGNVPDGMKKIIGRILDAAREYSEKVRPVIIDEPFLALQKSIEEDSDFELDIEVQPEEQAPSDDDRESEPAVTSPAARKKPHSQKASVFARIVSALAFRRRKVAKEAPRPSAPEKQLSERERASLLAEFKRIGEDIAACERHLKQIQDRHEKEAVALQAIHYITRQSEVYSQLDRQGREKTDSTLAKLSHQRSKFIQNA